jgi:hypothetical protein
VSAPTAAMQLAAYPRSPARSPRPSRPIIYPQPPTMPPALVSGYLATRSSPTSTTNPYALGLPSDDESQAHLWDDGHRAGSRFPAGV